MGVHVKLAWGVNRSKSHQHQFILWLQRRHQQHQLFSVDQEFRLARLGSQTSRRALTDRRHLCGVAIAKCGAIYASVTTEEESGLVN